MTTSLNPKLVTIRDLSLEDVPHVLAYWFHSPEGFVEAMGVDLAKLPSEEEMKKNLIKKITDNKNLEASQLNAFAILYDGQAIGIHTLFPIIDGDYGIFHAHIWKPEARSKGIGKRSYPLACQAFVERFNLKRILFKTPVQNVGAIRLKEKLGIPCVGEEKIDFGIIKAGTLAKVFELSKTEIGALLKS